MSNQCDESDLKPAPTRRLVLGGGTAAVAGASLGATPETASAKSTGQDASVTKLTVLYRTPSDRDAFLRRYLDAHLPLAQRIPGLIRTELAIVDQILAGDIDVFLIVELYFGASDFASAMQSSEMAAASDDVRQFVETPPIVLTANLLDAPL